MVQNKKKDFFNILFSIYFTIFLKILIAKIDTKLIVKYIAIRIKAKLSKLFITLEIITNINATKLEKEKSCPLRQIFLNFSSRK